MASGLDLVTKDSYGGEDLFAQMGASDIDPGKRVQCYTRSRMKRTREKRWEETGSPKLKSDRSETRRKDESSEVRSDSGYTTTPFAVEVAVAVADADDERRKKKDEWSEVESAERCRYTSHCECWLVSRTSNSKVKRSELDPLGNHREHPGFRFFAPYSSAQAKVTLLGDFRPTSAIPRDFPFWYQVLVIPDDIADVPTPPSPATSTISLSLFSLTCHLHRPAEVEEDFGISYYLPFSPPPSKLIPSIKHPLPPQAYDAEIIGSCNGLYCLRSEPFGNKVSVIVWNPSIPESRELPPFRHSSEDWSRLTFGFGYDQSSGDYKVVKIFAGDTLEVEVFSLYSKSNSWKSVQGFSFSQPRCDIQSDFCNGAVSYAGCLNWLVSISDDGRSQTVIVSFNLATEKFQILPLPPTYGSNSYSLDASSLWTLDGCLAFATRGSIILDDRSYSSHASRVLDIWKMREYSIESSWINIASIVFPHSVSSPYRILYFSKDVLILHLYHKRLFVFNLKENTLVCPHIQHNYDKYYGSHGGVEPYVYSQVSPHMSLQIESLMARMRNWAKLNKSCEVHWLPT